MHADLDDGIMEIDSIAIKKTNLKKRQRERAEGTSGTKSNVSTLTLKISQKEKREKGVKNVFVQLWLETSGPCRWLSW